ncbi:multiple epidermal growth factor-like domains protein 6 [Desmodus rotundus]|uniref:multiple epidermal growth factor-like domains protein 6 n=1 Tax=Desmodus rotundus TaxID=9430 RepID=UPI00238141FC|nr:multiple epidermal growth factor-like domains protein 6 [Desmodus rotundus]
MPVLPEATAAGRAAALLLVLLLPGALLRLQPSMPHVCAEQELTLVGRRQPCVQAFSRTVPVWKPGCGRQAWCVSQERRTVYYTSYRQVYTAETRTVLRCCPGWSQQPGAHGCLSAECSVGLCFNGGSCEPGSAQLCHCPPGFQGPRCQYDVNECATGNGGCEAHCCNTVGGFYCRCPPGRQLHGDGKTCRASFPKRAAVQPQLRAVCLSEVGAGDRLLDRSLGAGVRLADASWKHGLCA